MWEGFAVGCLPELHVPLFLIQPSDSYQPKSSTTKVLALGVWHTWENLLQNALNPWDWWDWLTIKPRAIWSLDSINLPSGHCIREGKKNVPAQHLQQHSRHSSCSLILWWCSTAPSSSITLTKQHLPQTKALLHSVMQTQKQISLFLQTV